MGNRVCSYCRTPINMLRADARFCSAKCRVYASRVTVPAALAGQDRWVRWKYAIRNGRATKVPVRLSGRPASSTDSRTWATYAAAKDSATGDGMGFVLNGDGVACIDLDHCLIEGKPTAAARLLLSRFPGAWVEYSPSGDGLHIWGTAQEQSGRRVTLDGLKVEFYTTGRYITVTGRTFRRGGMDAVLSL